MYKNNSKNIREIISLWWMNYHFLWNGIFHFFSIFNFPLFMDFLLDIYKKDLFSTLTILFLFWTNLNIVQITDFTLLCCETHAETAVAIGNTIVAIEAEYSCIGTIVIDPTTLEELNARNHKDSRITMPSTCFINCISWFICWACCCSCICCYIFFICFIYKWTSIVI